MEIHLTKPASARPNQVLRRRMKQYKSNRIALVDNYLNFRMDRMSLLFEYISSTIDALHELDQLEPENSMYRLGVMHMNILDGDYGKVEQEFLRIEADVDKSNLDNMQRSYYEYLRCLMLRDDDQTRATAKMIRKNYESGENPIFYFWLRPLWTLFSQRIKMLFIRNCPNSLMRVRTAQLYTLNSPTH